MASRRLRQRRPNRPNPKPYGFCCFPHDEILPRYGLDTSLTSLTSLHECPALKIRQQEIVKRPLTNRSKNSLKGTRNSAHKLSFQTTGVGSGGMKLNDATESMIELMIDDTRRQRQAMYERKMDRLAAIGTRKVKDKKMRKLPCFSPCWYTDYSLAQLQRLKDLEEAMFKDKKENTINRTANCLISIGMTTDFVKVDSQILRRLVNEYSTDIKTFICEIYKAIRGNYFEDEGIRLDYATHERIMISGVVFLELPEVILELYRRLPSIIKFKFPPKPKASRHIVEKKMISPLLEKLYPPVNWKLYATRLFKWRKKFLSIPRPVAILPKETKEIVDDNANMNEKYRKAIDEKNKKLDDNNQVEVKKIKSNVTTIDSDSKPKNSSHDRSENSDQDKQIKKYTRQVSLIEDSNQQDKPLSTIKNPWTEPPTPCPIKYIKLLRENGPLTTDDEFFSKLNRQSCKTQVSPSFRLQSILLDAEADLYGLMDQANELTGEVTRIAKEILEPDTSCDACCSCRETRRAHLTWHATKASHPVVDGVVTDENNKMQVIGAMAMHSPAESISSTSQPPCVPSSDRLVKNKIVIGTITTVDGDPVNQISGFTKAVEHFPREILRPDAEIVEMKNVPPCGCRDIIKSNEFEQQILSTKKEEALCYGKKFRPMEGPTYTCNEFGKKDETNECVYGEDHECEEEDYCVCNDDYEDCYEDDCCECGNDTKNYPDDDNDTMQKSIKKKQVICKRCGRELDANCVDIYTKKNHQSKASNRRKKVTNKCSCDSLSEFLQMDIGKTNCVMPKKNDYTKEVAKEKLKKVTNNKTCKSMQYIPMRIPTRKIVKTDRVKILQAVIKKNLEKDDEMKECSIQEIDEGGPYGYRTKSEEALPVERTLAYLTDLHPPLRQAERIPVREGGRPCCCRENRNKRKTLSYGIGAIVDENEANGTQLIDGLTWVTPVPSIRGSDEYIPEYELADSLYEKQICGTATKAGQQLKVDNKNTEYQRGKIKEGENAEEKSADRMGDWENAFKDEYLTEFFTKERDGIPCWTKNSKFKKKDKWTRKLKVMRPVCECKYERRIVKKIEERQKWHDRQQRLKSLNKEAFLHVDNIVKPKLSDSGENRDLTVVSAVVMQTPCDTPEERRSRSNLPYAVQKIQIETKNAEINEIVVTQSSDGTKNFADYENENIPLENKTIETIKGIEIADVRKDIDVNEMKENVEEEHEVREVEFTGKMSRQVDFFNRAEKEFAIIMRAELEKMSIETDFVSLKLPNYHNIAQLSSWISYRVRGMCFTEKFKKELMLETIKTWNSKNLTKNPSVEVLKVKKKSKCKLNFDYARYWKRRIGKLNRKFYVKTRQNVIEIGRQMWPTMEFGKFPHLLFKQAYFTYLPPREVDIYAFRTYLIN